MTRLWLDANVILRALTDDHPDHTPRAAAILQQAERGEARLAVSSLVVAEVVWVLKSFYRLPMERIAEVLGAFLASAALEVEDRSRMVEALELSRDKNVDFLDAALALHAADRGDAVCTFDVKDFKRLPGKWVEPPASRLA